MNIDSPPHTDHEKALLLGAGKPAWYNLAAQQGNTANETRAGTHSLTTIASVETRSTVVGNKTTGLYEEGEEVVEDEATVFGYLDAIIGSSWNGKLVSLPRKGNNFIDINRTHNEQRKMHEEAGNTTFPCPSDLVKFLEPRPILYDWPKEGDIVRSGTILDIWTVTRMMGPNELGPVISRVTSQTRSPKTAWMMTSGRM
jgi:hypothetical protein